MLCAITNQPAGGMQNETTQGAVNSPLPSRVSYTCADVNTRVQRLRSSEIPATCSHGHDSSTVTQQI